LWNKRVSGVVDLYKKMGSDIIMTTQTSQVTGVTFQKINSGNMENTGVETDLSIYPVRTKDWEFSVNVIYAYNKNILTKITSPILKNNSDIRTSNNSKVAGSALIEGEALNTLYAWHFAGLDPATGLPLFYENGSSTSIIDPVTRYPSTLEEGGVIVPNYMVYREKADLVVMGVTTPPVSGGINLALRYKNLRLRTNMVYSLGGVKRLPAIYSSTFDLLDPSKNATREYVYRWKEPGDELKTNIPALYNSDTYDNLPLLKRNYGSNNVDIAVRGSTLYNNSDVRIASTDNIRMNSATLSYLLSNKITKPMGIADAIVSLQVTNLFLIADSKWHGRDPEQSNSSNASLPRTFTMSLNVNF
jgi:hypothetical protein